MFPVKHTVIYTFFAITSVQNTCFCSVFNALASKNPAKSCYVQCFFHFWPFFHCRKATKMTQNSISIPSCAQTPKNPRKMSKTPPYSGLGAKPFLAPPPAKADIATAILTNVIEHLVLLFCPPISTPSPPKRCGRIFGNFMGKFTNSMGCCHISPRGATLSFTLRSKGEGGQPRYLIIQEIASHFSTPPPLHASHAP